MVERVSDVSGKRKVLSDINNSSDITSDPIEARPIVHGYKTDGWHLLKKSESICLIAKYFNAGEFNYHMSCPGATPQERYLLTNFELPIATAHLLSFHIMANSKLP